MIRPATDREEEDALEAFKGIVIGVGLILGLIGLIMLAVRAI